MNSQPNYAAYLEDVMKWKLRPVNEGNIKQLVFPSTSHRQAVQIANYLRQQKFSVKVEKKSDNYQEIIVTELVL